MKLYRIWRFLTGPAMMVYGKVSPVSYARHLGVRMTGKVTIYGSSYRMFGTEPYLITIGDNVHITPNVSFVTHDGAVLIARKDIPDLEIAKPITVGSNVFLGTMSLILPGVTIGNNCVIGARTVVSKDVPDNSVVVGNPARCVRSTEEYLEKSKRNSLHIGHLYGPAKVRAYKKIFAIEQSRGRRQR
jgi:serine acetyltransferase